MARRRDWSEARAKVEGEGVCRVCRARTGERRGSRIVVLEAAHVSGRCYDGPVVRACDVVPLCGPSGDSRACHTRYDQGLLELLPYLRRDEEVAAVIHLGLAHAYQRLTIQGERVV